MNSADVEHSGTIDCLATIDDFRKLRMVIGTVREATAHQDADRLVVLRVDVGEDIPRNLVAGIREHYEVDTLVGRQVVVLANITPATIRGVESQGMVLAAGSPSGLALLTPDRETPIGTQVS